MFVRRVYWRHEVLTTRRLTWPSEPTGQAEEGIDVGFPALMELVEETGSSSQRSPRTQFDGTGFDFDASCPPGRFP